ncbi:MAG TPA: NAD(+)--rifampin ADP-ribosyltransferase, partial [Bacteroidia bacterium]|nr:NAD(+)--rifampin ADP-ribosyltransferase [Bacteroidia bacterium]
MAFDPNNPVVKLCLLGMQAEEKEKQEEATEIFLQAWNQASNNFEKFLAAYYLARHQHLVNDTIKWLETTLQLALKINDETVKAAFPSLYSNLSKCYEKLGEQDLAKKNQDLAIASNTIPLDHGPFYHGTKASLHNGDLLTPGGSSNYKADLKMNHIYFTALVNGAGLAAALAKGDGPEHVYIVEPTGIFENDPN